MVKITVYFRKHSDMVNEGYIYVRFYLYREKVILKNKKIAN
jgi:hypothetical protein